MLNNSRFDALSKVRSSYQSIGGSDQDDDDSSSDEEVDLQKEVDEIMNSVLTLDLGDARSNKDLQKRANRFKEENLNITAQMSQRSKRSNRS